MGLTKVSYPMLTDPMGSGYAGNGFIGAFFRSNSDTSISLYGSNNGLDFRRANSPMITTDGAFTGRDPSIYIKDGTAYIAVTGYSAGSYDITIWKSTDLLNWTKHTATLGTSAVVSTTTPAPGGSVPCERCWAPEWFEYSGTLYVLVSLQYAANQIDIEGNSIPFLRPFYSQCTSLENLTFAAPVQLSIGTASDNKIDPAMIMDGGTIRCAIKNEYAKTIEIWQNSSLSGTWTINTTLTMGGSSLNQTAAEGPSIVKIGSTFRIYFDHFKYGKTGYIDTTNFSTYTAEKFINVVGNQRHGSVISLDALSANDQIFAKQALASIVATGDEKYFDLDTNSNLGSGAITIFPAENTVYFVNASNAARLTIGATTANQFYVCLLTDSTTASITFPASSTYFAEGVVGVDTVIGKQARNTLVPLRLGADNKYRIVGLADGVVDSGSNAEGNYVKFADGTMICRGNISNSSTGGATSKTFPVAFDAPPQVTITPLSSVARMATREAVTSADFTFSVWSTAGTRVDSPVAWIAIGNWY